MHSPKPVTSLYFVLCCCISFMLGHSFASTRLAPASFVPWISSIQTANDSPEAFTVDTKPSSFIDDDHERKKGELRDYIYDLIDSTLGTELLHETNMTATERRQLFQGALIHALSIEKFGCEKTAKVLPKEMLRQSELEKKEVVEDQGSREEKNERSRETPDEVPARKRRIPDSVEHFSGIGRVDRTDFNTVVNTGVPLFLSNPRKSDVLIMYGSTKTLPDDLVAVDDVVFAGDDGVIHADQALKNCLQLSVIHLKAEVEDKCWAFLPGQESFHVQKWLRVSPSGQTKANMSMPLRLVPRGKDLWNGAEYPQMPNEAKTRDHRKWLGEYFLHSDMLAAEIKPIAERIAVNNQLIFTVVNAGQSELLLNFACAAKSRGLDISKVLAFVLDEESKVLVEGLGMAAYYNEKFLGALSSKDGFYGDKNFASVVTAKLMGPHLLSMLGYDFLAQDVDLFWYKDPLTFFNDPNLADPDIDIFFQDDVNGGIRFQPWRGNSGFYFLRNNERTRVLMKDFVMMTDHLSASHCDQQTLMEVLSEHVSLWGLRIKTFDADDTNFFPAGGHFHLKKDFMKDFVTGKLENDVYVFHMNWTGGKKEKMEYLMQMGQWYVKDTCKNEVLQVMLTSHSNLTNTLAANETIENTCCSKEALFSCHFRDKASIKPCKNSTAKFGESPSWW